MTLQQEIPPLPEAAEAMRGSRSNQQTWMVTFTDLIALLLTFFVMLFAMMSVQAGGWRDLTNSLAQELQTLGPRSVAQPSQMLDMPSVQVAPGANLDYLATLLQSRLDELSVLSEARILRKTDHLNISFPSELLFAPGTTTPKADARAALFELGGLLRHIDNVVEVAGHADPTAIRNGPFVSNWELSLARAAAVGALLRAAGVEGELTVLGYGETRFDALPDGLSSVEALALARRVEILIHESAGEP
ncbi:OmpA/MotB family protein [Algihabitans albus]|uniref:OmpA/MotB family protein n=1 Tax=Algihabitans albus TaxID=2164067 RepID=UPI000E5D6BB4|nr:flagellar motor protein MotB [Algihabitans albus]